MIRANLIYIPTLVVYIIYFDFFFVSCNTLKVSQSMESCIPIAFLGMEELENKKELKKEDVISIIKQRFCLAEAMQFKEISIRFKKIDYVTDMTTSFLKFSMYLWYWRDINFFYELDYSVTNKEGKTISGILKKEVKYKKMEIRTLSLVILSFFIVDNPSLIAIFLIHPFGTGALLIDEGYFQSHNNFAVEKMTYNLIKEIVAKSNQDIKE